MRQPVRRSVGHLNARNGTAGLWRAPRAQPTLGSLMAPKRRATAWRACGVGRGGLPVQIITAPRATASRLRVTEGCFGKISGETDSETSRVREILFWKFSQRVRPPSRVPGGLAAEIGAGGDVS
jgi:hypothetical protein